MVNLKKYKHEFWRNFPLFLCGVFLVYVAAADETLFNWIAVDMTNRLIVTVATIISAALPMFFAVGAIKQSILYGRETLYYYEKMLKHWIFWLSSGVCCIGIAIVRFTQADISLLGKFGFIALTGLVAVYFIYYALTLAGKSQNPAPQQYVPQYQPRPQDDYRRPM